MRTSLRSEEHTSELQSRRDLVCRLLLEKKKKKYIDTLFSKKKKKKKKVKYYTYILFYLLYVILFFFFFLLTIFLFFFFFFIFFNDTATTEIYTLSLHDALPISCRVSASANPIGMSEPPSRSLRTWRSEEHTSELQSRRDLVCRLLLEKKKK